VGDTTKSYRNSGSGGKNRNRNRTSEFAKLAAAVVVLQTVTSFVIVPIVRDQIEECSCSEPHSGVADPKIEQNRILHNAHKDHSQRARADIRRRIAQLESECHIMLRKVGELEKR